MTSRAAIIVSLLACTSSIASAQSLGTFRWQLQPFCNVVTLAVTQNGGVFGLEGTDDQCGAGGTPASAIGTAFLNADGSVALGLTLIAAPGGTPTHVMARISVGTLGGAWQDSGGARGTFTFTTGAGTGGNPRPVPSPSVSLPAAFVFQADGGFVAGGAFGATVIPREGPGARTMWYPGKAAFRAGHVESSEWNDVNVGVDSAAFGRNTVASGRQSFAFGGETIALGAGSFAGGGESSALSTFAIALGDHATAGGLSSVALGFHATTTGTATGSFVYADRSSSDAFTSFLPNEFQVRASGGVGFYSKFDLTTGVTLAANGSQWLQVSDVNTKERFRDLDDRDLLAKIAGMPVQEWSYKAQGASVRHVGPTAQDFHAAFGLGEDPLRIGTLDASGIAMAGLRALEARTREHDDALVRENDTLKAAIAELRARLDQIERRLERR